MRAGSGRCEIVSKMRDLNARVGDMETSDEACHCRLPEVDASEECMLKICIRN